MKRLILLNALPLNAFFTPTKVEVDFKVRRIFNPEVLKRVHDIIVKYGGEVKCYIRHPATVKSLERFLETELKPSAELYQFERGDQVFIATLMRPVRGREVERLSIHDLAIFEVYVYG